MQRKVCAITEDKRYQIRDKTNALVYQHLRNPNSSFLSEKDKVCLYTNDQLQYNMSSTALLPPFDVLQVPCYMDYDENWDPRLGKQEYFFGHHVAAPDLSSDYGFGEYSEDGKLVEKRYLEDMRILFNSTLKPQALSGAEDAVWVPLGMGAFLDKLGEKDARYKDPQVMDSLRGKLADLFFGAVLQEPDLHVHLCLIEAAPENKRAFESILSSPVVHPDLKTRVTIHVDEDATQVAQDLANQNGAYSVSFMNAANCELIGNHWFGKGALRAIDENFHRRSAMAAYYAARLNGYNPNNKSFGPKG